METSSLSRIQMYVQEAKWGVVHDLRYTYLNLYIFKYILNRGGDFHG